MQEMRRNHIHNRFYLKNAVREEKGSASCLCNNLLRSQAKKRKDKINTRKGMD